jgi:O-antigen ligase
MNVNAKLRLRSWAAARKQPAVLSFIPAVVRWLFLAYVFSIPFEAVELGPAVRGIFTISRFIGLMLFAICCIYPKLWFSRPNRILLWLAFYLLICVFHGIMLQGSQFGEFRYALFTFIQLMGMFWIGSGLLRNDRLTKSVLLVFAFSAVLMALSTLFGIPGISSGEKTRLGARLTMEDVNPNYMAYMAAMGAVILLGFVMNGVSRMWIKNVLFIACALPLLAVTVLSGSRAGVVGLVIGLAIYASPFLGTKRRLIAAVLGALALSAVIYMVTSSRISASRFEDAYSHGDSRSKIFQRAIDTFTDRPVFGWGVAEGRRQLTRNLGYRMTSAHNIFLQILIDVGLAGAVCIIAALGCCFAAAWKSRFGPFGLIPFALLVCLLIVNQVHDWMYFKATWLILAIAAGRIHVVSHRNPMEQRA